MLFHPLYYDIISLISLKITQAFHLLLVFAENQIVFCDFKIQNSFQVTEGLDNAISNNRNSTVICLQSKKHKHTLITLTGLAFLAHLSHTVNYKLAESYCTCLQLEYITKDHIATHTSLT